MYVCVHGMEEKKEVNFCVNMRLKCVYCELEVCVEILICMVGTCVCVSDFVEIGV
jgi:hypothetical protein